MLAKYIIEKYGYKWDDNWQDTDNIDLVLKTMESFDEDLKKVVIDIANYFKGQSKNQCPYCGGDSDSTDPKILCAECRYDFGHTSIDEL
jgi:DNA-directed RNA polymerase subunit RPC12/RpoP